MKKILIIAALCLMCMSAKAQVNMYEVKSGIVTMEMDMMGRKIVQEIYFDDYGAKQAMMVDFQGKKMRAVEVDGENVMIDDEQKTAMKMPAMGMTNEKINFLEKFILKMVTKKILREAGEFADKALIDTMLHGGSYFDESFVDPIVGFVEADQ